MTERYQQTSEQQKSFNPLPILSVIFYKLQLTAHLNMNLATLDIAVKVNQNKIVYKFYKKPIASKKVILVNSALPSNIKRAALTEGAI